MPVTTISSAASTASCSTWRKPRRKFSTSSAARPTRTAHEVSAQCQNFSRTTGRLPVCRGAVSGRHFSAVELIAGLRARRGYQAARGGRFAWRHWSDGDRGGGQQPSLLLPIPDYQGKRLAG